MNNSISNDLVLITSTQDYKDALAALNAALDRASKLSSKDTYTEASYSTYKTAYDAAVVIKNNAATKTSTDMKLATQKLNDAIDNLQYALDTLKDELNALIVTCIDIISAKDDYVPDTFTAFETAYKNARTVVKGTDITAIKQATTNLKNTKSALKLIDDELNALVKSVESMKTASNVAEALNMSAQNASDKLKKIENIKKAVKQDLEDVIQEGNVKIVNDVDGSLTSVLANAKKVFNSTNATVEKLVEAYVNLSTELNK